MVTSTEEILIKKLKKYSRILIKLQVIYYSPQHTSDNGLKGHCTLFIKLSMQFRQNIVCVLYRRHYSCWVGNYRCSGRFCMRTAFRLVHLPMLLLMTFATVANCFTPRAATYWDVWIFLEMAQATKRTRQAYRCAGSSCKCCINHS